MIKLQNIFSRHLPHHVIPAKAVIHFDFEHFYFKHFYFKQVRPIKSWVHKWIPAFAGMTA